MKSSERTSAASPSQVIALARRYGVTANGSSGEQVRLTQSGTLRFDPTVPWMPFRAMQTRSNAHCEFVSRARIGPFGFITLTEALERTGPRLNAVLLGGIPLVGAPVEAALTKGELQQYLGELPHAPDAILRNPALRWQVLGPKRIKVSATHEGVSAQVILQLGANGLIETAHASDRPRSEGKVFVERAWVGRFTDYRTHQGRQIPFASEFVWKVDDKVERYWRGTISEWDAGGTQ